MSSATSVLDIYLTGLRNQHAVETQAIGTLQNEMPRTKAYPALHTRMEQDKEQATRQAARLDEKLGRHGTRKALAKEAVAGTVATVAGFIHAPSSDDVLKNVLAAIGYKAYEIASYKTLLTLADAAGAVDDKVMLEKSMQEEQEMGDWLGSHLPEIVQAYVQQQAS